MQQQNNKARVRLIIIAYPVVLLLAGLGLNLLLFGLPEPQIALPEPAVLTALALAMAGLVLNHSWLMTSTELTRLRYDLHATPEEWAARGRDQQKASGEGLQELQRQHNTHRNANENSLYFALAALPFLLLSPPALMAQIWFGGFVLGRLGHSYSFLTGRDGLRGLFMSLSLLALYAMASWTVLALLTPAAAAAIAR